MNYKEFVKKGLVVEKNIGFDQIDKLLDRAFKNIKSAEVLVKNDDKEGLLDLPMSQCFWLAGPWFFLLG